MKRLLLPLLAAIALPTAVGGNTITKISDTNLTSKESEEFTDTNTFCRDSYANEFYKKYRTDDVLKFTALSLLKSCMRQNGYENVDCGDYGGDGVCKLQ